MPGPRKPYGVQEVIILLEAWQVTYWNHATERLYAFTSAEVLGRKITERGIIAGSGIPSQDTTGQENADGIAADRVCAKPSRLCVPATP